MKLFKDTKGITTTMAVLGLLVLAVVVVALMGIAPTEEVPDEEVAPTIAGQETGPFEITLVDSNGTTLTSDSTVSVYLTSPDVYTTVFEAYDAIDKQGRLVDPYDASIAAGSKRSTPTDGVVSFTVTSKKYTAGDEVETGSDFGIFVMDTGVLELRDYNTEVGKVKINARLNDELTVISTVVEGVPGYFGSEIEVSRRGNASFYDSLSGDDNMGTYNLDTELDEEIEDQDFDLNVRLNGDDTELRYISTYIEVGDDVTNTSDLTLDDVEISVNGVKITGTSLTEVSDLASRDPLRKNAPSLVGATADSTLYVVEDGQFDLARINADNYDKAVITLTDYDADMSAVTTIDACRFVVTLVASNGHKDSNMVGDDFYININESVTSGYVAE